MGKIKLLLYCCKNKKQLFYDAISQKYMYGLNGKNDKFNSLNGKIVAECDYEVERILSDGIGYWGDYTPQNELAKQSCLNYDQVHKYLNNNDGYAIHIKNLNIFDKPRELSCYSTYIKEIVDTWWFYLNHKKAKQLEKAPQNMMYCYGNNTGEKYILISIRPEWLCKILTGEKTIEVRKKVLKEMITDA